MLNALIVMVGILPVTACIFGSICMMYFEKPGWGWLIFLAVLLGRVSFNFVDADE